MMHYPKQLPIILSLGALLGGCNVSAPIAPAEAVLAHEHTYGPEVQVPTAEVTPTRLDTDKGTPSVVAQAVPDKQCTPSPTPTEATAQTPPTAKPDPSSEMPENDGLPTALPIKVLPPKPTRGFQSEPTTPRSEWDCPPSPVGSEWCFEEEGNEESEEGDMKSRRGSRLKRLVSHRWSARSLNSPSPHLISLCEGREQISAEDESRIKHLFSADKEESRSAGEALMQSLKHANGAYINGALHSFVDKLSDTTPDHAYAHMLNVVETLLKANRRRSNWFLLLERTISHQHIASVCIPTYKVLRILLQDPCYGEKERIWTLVCQEVERLHAKIQASNQEYATKIAQAQAAVAEAQDSGASAQQQEQLAQELFQLKAHASAVDSGLCISIHKIPHINQVFRALQALGFEPTSDTLAAFKAVVGNYTCPSPKPAQETEAARSSKPRPQSASLPRALSARRSHHGHL